MGSNLVIISSLLVKKLWGLFSGISQKILWKFIERMMNTFIGFHFETGDFLPAIFLRQASELRNKKLLLSPRLKKLLT